MLWLLNTVHFSPSAWPDSSYDRHAGKRTIAGQMTHSRGERDTSCSTLAKKVACCTLDFELSCQISFGIPQTRKVDSCRPPDITLITEKSFDIRRRTATGCKQLWLNVRSWETKEDWCRSHLNLGCGACVSGWHIDNTFRQVRSALLTLHVCINIYIYLLF